MSHASSTSSPTRRNSRSMRFNPIVPKSKFKPKPKQIQGPRILKQQPKFQTTQREIFDWYERNGYKDDAGDIFSSEWQNQLVEWSKEFGCDNISDICEVIKSHEQNPEELELGCIFQAHPVAGFSLWHVLQSCYELDRIICATEKQCLAMISEWKKMRPFQYLLSQDIARHWQENVRGLLSAGRSSTDKFQGEIHAQRLKHIAHAIDALKEAVTTLTSTFEGKREELACAFWMLKVVQENVDKRWP
ncbi:hypothetical protein F4806DRAFT_464517 [Annulohypoxylon nitens]|nr:hypothetical protein F4806DRAFT_464517 [Annulohypoxylon nitens]